MPSWNIHTAHVERLLADEPCGALGIRSTNEFMFGNIAPDVYVGYVVPNTTRTIAYKDTHFANPAVIPTPNAARFYELFVRDQPQSDLALGVWTHLICDHYYNLRTIEYIARIGVEAGTQTRIRKQADFDVYGRTFGISLVLTASDGLLESCAHFAQYAIAEPDVRAAIAAQQAIVQKNRDERVEGTPVYSLFTPEFFSQTYTEVDALLKEALHTHMSGGDPTHIGRPNDAEA